MNADKQICNDFIYNRVEHVLSGVYVHDDSYLLILLGDTLSSMVVEKRLGAWIKVDRFTVD